MGVICGILGRCDTTALDAMERTLTRSGGKLCREEGPDYCWAGTSAPSGGVLADGIIDTPGNMKVSTALRRLEVTLSGAYAVVARDESRGAWLLARDRIGRRPLYYHQGDGWLAFASELKALLASGLFDPHLDLASVDQYLTLQCVPSPSTIFQGVRKTRPGQTLEYRNGVLKEATRRMVDVQSVPMEREAAAHLLLESLREAAEEAPLQDSVLLWSAGLDSAALGVLRPALARLFVTLDRNWQDETRLAKESSRRMTLPIEVESARRFTEEVFTKVCRGLDEPIADASLFPQWQIYERASKRAKTAITGHCADELLGGYPRYRYLERAQGARGLMPAAPMSMILPALPPNAFVRRAGNYLASMGNFPRAYLSLLSVFDEHERRDLYTDAMHAALHGSGEARDCVSEHFTGPDLTRNLLSFELGVLLPDLVLAGSGQTAASHGLHLWHPYLNDALVEFAATLPPEACFGVRSKPLLRLAMKGLVPPMVRMRKRRGFATPQSGRVLRVIENVARQNITPEQVDATGLFKWSAVASILRSANHNVFRRRQFWALLIFFTWYREVMEGRA